MNNAETVCWLEQQGCFRHWILPELGVNEGTAHSDHDVGNTPEVVPLDCYLFNVSNDVFDRHVIITSRLEINDPKKISLSTPEIASTSYRQVWQGCPSKERINHYMLKLTDDV